MPERQIIHEVGEDGSWMSHDGRSIWVSNFGDSDRRQGLIVNSEILLHHPDLDLSTTTGNDVHHYLRRNCSDCPYQLASDRGLASSLLDNLPAADSPDYLQRWVDQYRTMVYDPEGIANRALMQLSVDGVGRGVTTMPCIDPLCTGRPNVPTSILEKYDAPIRQCPMCNHYTCVPLQSLVRGDELAPLAAVGLMGSSIAGRVVPATRWRQMVHERQVNPEVIRLEAAPRDSATLLFGFNGEYFQRNRDHFIRARANFETINSVYRMHEYEELELMAWSVNQLFSITGDQWDKVMDIVERISADPLAILDEDKASSIRDDLARAAWSGSEYRRFLRSLISTGILKDGAPLPEKLGDEFWQFLYGMVCKQRGLSPIIKRTGRVAFPTAEVVAGITLPAIEKSWRDFAYRDAGDILDYFEEDRLGTIPELTREEDS